MSKAKDALLAKKDAEIVILKEKIVALEKQLAEVKAPVQPAPIPVQPTPAPAPAPTPTPQPQPVPVGPVIIIPPATKTYYVSATGNDVSGTHSAPMSILHAKHLQPSRYVTDRVKFLFKAGDIFYDTLPLRKGTSIDRYGDAAANPVISGGVELKAATWTQKGNIWSTPLAVAPKMVWRNGVFLTRARDNKVYQIGNKGSSKSLVIPDLPTRNYTGCGFYLKNIQWADNFFQVLSSNGTTKTLTLGEKRNTPTPTTAIPYNYEVGDTCFIDNHIDFLTQEGYWFHGNGLLHIYSATNPNTSASLVASVTDYGFSATAEGENGGQVTGMSILNIDFAHQATDAINLHGFYKDLEIANCNVTGARRSGFRVFSSGGYDPVTKAFTENVSIRNNKISQCGNWGILGRDWDRAEVFGNAITETHSHLYGQHDYEENFDNCGGGITLITNEYTHGDIKRISKDNIIRDNQIEGGIVGIEADGENTRVTGNKVKDPCKRNMDKGGLYMWGGSNYNRNVLWENNEVEVNYAVSPQPHIPFPPRLTYPMVMGYYIDEHVDGVKALNNRITGTGPAVGAYINSSVKNAVLKGCQLKAVRAGISVKNTTNVVATDNTVIPAAANTQLIAQEGTNVNLVVSPNTLVPYKAS